MNRGRRSKKRRIWPIILAVAALAGTIYYHNSRFANWINPPPPPVYAPAKPEQELLTGAGSAQFPIYAPQYPGSTIADASRFTDAAGGLTMVLMTTPDDLPTVSEFYRRGLAEKGFRPKLNKAGKGLSIAGARSSAGLSVLIGLQPRDEGGTSIELTDTSNDPVAQNENRP